MGSWHGTPAELLKLSRTGLDPDPQLATTAAGAVMALRTLVRYSLVLASAPMDDRMILRQSRFGQQMHQELQVGWSSWDDVEAQIREIPPKGWSADPSLRRLPKSADLRRVAPPALPLPPVALFPAPAPRPPVQED